MPGLRGVPLPAAAVRPSRPDRPVVGQGAARCGPGAARRCGARWARRYDAVHSHEEGGLIGVVLSAMLGVPHLYDMHSSLPQQLSNFDFSLVEAAGLGHGAGRAPAGAAVARGDRHLPAARRGRAGHRPAGPDGADRERARLGRSAGGRGQRVAAGRSGGSTHDVPVVLYTGTFEAYQGLDLLYAAAARVRATRPDVRFLVVGGAAGSGRVGQAPGARRRSRGRRGLHRPAALGRDSRSSSTRRRSSPRRAAGAPTRR